MSLCPGKCPWPALCRLREALWVGPAGLWSVERRLHTVEAEAGRGTQIQILPEGSILVNSQQFSVTFVREAQPYFPLHLNTVEVVVDCVP